MTDLLWQRVMFAEVKNASNQFERSMLNSEHTEQMQFTQTMRIFWCGQ